MNIYEQGITIPHAKALRVKLNTLLAGFKEEGISVQLGNCSVAADGDEATFKLIIKREGGQSKEAKDLVWMAEMMKLDTTKQVVIGTSGKCQLTGYRTKARGKPWIITQVDMAGKPSGKSFILTDEQATKFFAKGS